jgi:hypothetical protein
VSVPYSLVLKSQASPVSRLDQECQWESNLERALFSGWRGSGAQGIHKSRVLASGGVVFLSLTFGTPWNRVEAALNSL